eukprot:COSAG04_NODE_10702_length_758_cov_0.787557_1_plen_132_part_00
MFSAAMLSVNGTTVTSTASNVADISRLQLRTEHTKAGADGPGSAGLLSFNQTMTPEEATSDVLDNAAGGSNTTAVSTASHENTLIQINRGLFHKHVPSLLQPVARSASLPTACWVADGKNPEECGVVCLGA